MQELRKMKGYKVTMQRDLTFSGIYWVMVEQIRKSQNRGDLESYLIRNVVAGVIAGGFTSFITLPLDVVKTRI